MFFWRERIEPSGAFYGVEWGFTDRRGGSSQSPFGDFNLAVHVGDHEDAVETNRHRLAHELGLRLADLTFMGQVHGCGVALTERTRDEEPALSPPVSVDGLVSGSTDEALVVLVADCVPVLLLDRTEGLVAAVHAGREGLATGVVPAAVRRMRDLGAGAITAWVGPRVCAGCYEVPAAMRAEVAAADPPSTAAGVQPPDPPAAAAPPIPAPATPPPAAGAKPISGFSLIFGALLDRIRRLFGRGRRS